jgi:hypothetical protein
MGYLNNYFLKTYKKATRSQENYIKKYKETYATTKNIQRNISIDTKTKTIYKYLNPPNNYTDSNLFQSGYALFSVRQPVCLLGLYVLYS